MTMTNLGIGLAARPPMPFDQAESLAKLAVAHPSDVAVGPRVLASLLAELERREDEIDDLAVMVVEREQAEREQVAT